MILLQITLPVQKFSAPSLFLSNVFGKVLLKILFRFQMTSCCTKAMFQHTRGNKNPPWQELGRNWHKWNTWHWKTVINSIQAPEKICEWQWADRLFKWHDILTVVFWSFWMGIRWLLSLCDVNYIVVGLPLNKLMDWRGAGGNNCNRTLSTPEHVLFFPSRSLV